MAPFTDTRALTDDIIAALEAGGLTVGDADGQELDPPYGVVFPIGGLLDGSLANPDEDGESVVQVSAVGVSRRQAEWVRDEARAVMLAEPAVTGRNVQRVSVDNDVGVRRDDDVEPPQFFIPERYRILHTPT